MDPLAMTFRFVSAVGIGVLCAFTATASPIAVVNFSFETTPTGGLNNSCTLPSVCSFSINPKPIPGWTHNGGATFVFGELKPGVPDNIFNTLTNGFAVGYSTGGTLDQTVTNTVQLGLTYTLLVDLGERKDLGTFMAGADLRIGNTKILAVGTAPGAGNWSTYTVTYTGLKADVGKSITIQLISNGSQAEFDNVRLSALAPEPAGVTLLGLGLAGLLVFARRKRAS